MTKIRKQSRNKTYNYTKDRKRSWKNKNKLQKITCETVSEAWDEKKSVAQNMQDMGLSADSNQTIRIPKTKEFLTKSAEVVMAIKSKKKKAVKHHVVDALEKQANIPQEARLRLSDLEVRYCAHMMEKHGEDYKAMARDPKNYYQDTPKQIKKKINRFKNIPEQYEAYLRSKERVMSRVKRKLNFGRKPPKERDVTPTTSNTSRASKKKSKTGSRVRNVKKSVRRTGNTVCRELRNLLNSAATVILPVRLRSDMRRLGRTGSTSGGRMGSGRAGYPLKSSPEVTHLPKRRSTHKTLRRSKEVVTGDTIVR
ncbi:nucleolar protein 16-like isoform X2 [Haliotis rufescens]|uniref:nucleolar protein 16-like isoform X2 n=1 Tax=Haliotis rufescens TaxID=6454 RepID=UPI001EB036C5|nr:nucleolar protein 16-like isoform X2 [Haliotis rufescens]